MFSALQIVNWMRVKNKAELTEKDYAEELTQLKAMKLLYYAYGVYLAYTGKKLFPEPILAWKYGPAVKEVHDKYKGQREIVGEISETDLDDYNKVNSTPKVNDVINTVWDEFANRSAYDLMEQTHNESPWKTTKQSHQISDEAMHAYFDEVVIDED